MLPELSRNGSLLSYSLYFVLKICFRARNVTGTFEKRAPGPEMRPGIVSGIVTGDVPVSYWLNFPAPSNSPRRSLRKVTRPNFFLKWRLGDYLWESRCLFTF